MNYGEMKTAVEDAERTLRFADMAADDMARMLIGRLRKVHTFGVLADLKRELKGYNIHTGTWK